MFFSANTILSLLASTTSCPCLPRLSPCVRFREIEAIRGILEFNLKNVKLLKKETRGHASHLVLSCLLVYWYLDRELRRQRSEAVHVEV